MKKIVSLLTALVLVLSLGVAAFADGIEDWVAIPLNYINMQFSAPSDMVLGEPDAELNQAFIAANDDLVLTISIISAEGLSVDDLIAQITEAGGEAVVNGLADSGIDSIDHIAVANPADETTMSFIFLGADNNYYEFECQSLSEDGFVVFGMILATLQPIA